MCPRPDTDDDGGPSIELIGGYIVEHHDPDEERELARLFEHAPVVATEDPTVPRWLEAAAR